jgi:hypothetical protein
MEVSNSSYYMINIKKEIAKWGKPKKKKTKKKKKKKKKTSLIYHFSYWLSQIFLGLLAFLTNLHLILSGRYF